MFELSRARKELKKLYEAWYQEVKDTKLLTSDAYTNPSYIGVPDNWFKYKHRILIVGEEMFGEDGNGKDLGYRPGDITKLQNYNLKVFQDSMMPPEGFENPFWPRARRVEQLGWPCTWTFLDKVGRKWQTRSRLTDQDREMLHSVQTRVLKEEIRILQPTVIFFFGWIGTALKKELPEIYHLLYPGGDNDDSLWKNTFVSFSNGKMLYLFSYSPYSPSWRKKPKTYEDDLIERVSDFTGIGKLKHGASSIKESNYGEERDLKVVKRKTEIRSDIVEDAVASYVIGKAVGEKRKQSPLAKNPYTEKYAEQQRKLDLISGQRIALNKQECVSCAYWCGQRQVVTQPGGRGYVQLPRYAQPARCSKQSRTVSLNVPMCRDWTPLK